MSPDQKFFVFDVESVGLHGQGFAVAGGAYDVRGKAVGAEFAIHTQTALVNGCGDCGQDGADRAWIRSNVTTAAKSVECSTSLEVREQFWSRWRNASAQNPGLLMFVECGWPVEARFLMECIADHQGTRNWQGPYPMHEIATLMLAAGMDPMATYERLPHELPAHEPLADARLSARLLATALAKLNLIDQ
jgi:hypothetical protein